MADEIAPNTNDGMTSNTSEPTPTPTWRDSLPDELKAEKSFEKFSDVGGLAKSFLELEKLRGNSIQLPSDTSKPEEWGRIYEKLGRPGKPEDYKLEKPKEFPKGMGWSPEAEADFRKFAHSQGWNQAQTQNVLNKWHGTLTQMVESAQYSVEKGKAQLMEKLGKDGAEKTVKLCQQAVAEFGDDEFADFLDQSGFGNHPEAIKFLSKIGALLVEDRAPVPGDQSQTETSKNDAMIEIARIRSDKAHPYHKSEPTALNRMAELYTIAYGNKVVAEVR